VFGFVLFFVTGLAFGAVVASRWAWASLLVPIVLAVVSVIANGIDAHLLLTLLLALLVTGAGVIAGRLLARRLEARGRPGRGEPAAG
jgi:hypothetical protein